MSTVIPGVLPKKVFNNISVVLKGDFVFHIEVDTDSGIVLVPVVIRDADEFLMFLDKKVTRSDLSPMDNTEELSILAITKAQAALKTSMFCNCDSKLGY